VAVNSNGFPREKLHLCATLSHIISQAVAHTDSDWFGGLEFDELLQLLDVGPFRSRSKTRNDHLANPLNREDGVCYTRPRSTPFTGDEPVFGEFLTLKYCGHYPYAVLCDYDNEDKLENAILGLSGQTNPFTTYLIAYKHHTLRPYSLSFTNSDGDRVPFAKERQYEPPSYPMSETFPNLQVHWD